MKGKGCAKGGNPGIPRADLVSFSVDEVSHIRSFSATSVPVSGLHMRIEHARARTLALLSHGKKPGPLSCSGSRGGDPRSAFSFNRPIGLIPRGKDGRRSASPQPAAQAPPARRSARLVASTSSARCASGAPPTREEDRSLEYLWGSEQILAGTSMC